ncbi:MAG: Co2+/Mg2+ efflux protein ApaG [Candidatus Hydrogenedentes bacterium]|nr:Co2+/Mg2+ efflux protein ApaG [Candidatus Hydrogenedentota bacterium]
MSNTLTQRIRVRCESYFVPERSSQNENLYYFGYRIRITNEGMEPVQLISRHWTITDGLGKVEEVRGPGVVGQQPRLDAGETFEYTSACPLHTSYGTMQGRYRMARDDGSTFHAEITPFEMIVPAVLN